MTDQDLLFQAAHALITAYDCINGEDEKAVAERAINALLDRLADVDPAKVGEVGDGFMPHKLFVDQALAALAKAQGENNG